MRYFSMGRNHPIEQIKAIYHSKREEIGFRLGEFGNIWKTGTQREIFGELVYCILTPMARGKMCCAAVDTMVRTGILFTGNSSRIKRELIGARFIHKKSAYIVEAREKFLGDGSVSLKSIIGQINDGRKARGWLVHNVKGIGYKEASHFLRNIGFDQDLAILDRHVVRNLKLVGVVKEIPASLSSRRYLEMEKRMVEFSRTVQIPMSYLDLVMWYKETGEILK
jgi:N-glycosylase/DNA lyase